MGPKRVDVLALDGGEVPRLGALDADHGARQVVDALRTGPRRRGHPAAVPDAAGQAGGVRLDAVGEPLDADGALEVADRFPPQRAEQSQHALLREVLNVVRAGVQRLLVVVVEHRSAHRHPGIDPPTGQQVNGGQILGEPERILQTQGDDGRAQFDAAGSLAGRRHHGDRGGDAGLQVPAAKPDTVEPQRFGALDHLQRLLEPRARVLGVETADGQEAELAQRFTSSRHEVTFQCRGDANSPESSGNRASSRLLAVRNQAATVADWAAGSSACAMMSATSVIGFTSSASSTSAGTSSRSGSLRAGMKTVDRPARWAASSFCLTPPIGSTRPFSVTSPVMPTSDRTCLPVAMDTSAVTMVTPADGPSLGTAPAGTCTWIWRSNAFGSTPSCSAWART